jgi:hypothetical protein
MFLTHNQILQKYLMEVSLCQIKQLIQPIKLEQELELANLSFLLNFLLSSNGSLRMLTEKLSRDALSVSLL